jgi:hypothetical protein
MIECEDFSNRASAHYNPKVYDSPEQARDCSLRVTNISHKPASDLSSAKCLLPPLGQTPKCDGPSTDLRKKVRQRPGAFRSWENGVDTGDREFPGSGCRMEFLKSHGILASKSSHMPTFPCWARNCYHLRCLDAIVGKESRLEAMRGGGTMRSRHGRRPFAAS